MEQDSNWASLYDAVLTGTPPIWLLVHAQGEEAGGDQALEEVVLSVQGIIYRKDLPPFLEKIRSE